MHIQKTVCLLLTALVFDPAVGSQAAQPVGVVEFQNQSYGYRAEKTKFALLWSGTTGSDRIEIKDCNRQTVDAFWNDLVKAAATVRKKPAPPAHQRATVSFNKVTVNIYDFEPAFQRLNRADQKWTVTRIESLRRCRK